MSVLSWANEARALLVCCSRVHSAWQLSSFSSCSLDCLRRLGSDSPELQLAMVGAWLRSGCHDNGRVLLHPSHLMSQVAYQTSQHTSALAFVMPARWGKAFDGDQYNRSGL